jgi:hypothetical protein
MVDYENQDENCEGCEGDEIAEGLIEGLSVGDVDRGWTGWDSDGDETILSFGNRGDWQSIERNAPGWVVAEVEDEVCGDG